MANCEFENKLEAYHDGELTAAEASAVQSHLVQCSDCQIVLQQIESMSQLLVSSTPNRLSQISRHRLHMAVDTAMERGLLRFAWLMSGIAASVLLVGSAWLFKSNDSVQAQMSAEAPPWVSVSLAGNRDPVVREAVSPAAQFYLADASTSDSTPNP